MRTLDTSVSNALSLQQNHFFHLITFYFGTTIRLTDHSHDLEYDFGLGTETFSSTGRIVSIGSPTESLELNNPTLSLTLSGANAAEIALALTENYNDQRILIRRGIFDSSGQTQSTNILTQPFYYFDGRVDSFSIQEDYDNGSSAITWKLASHWADWDKINTRKCNNKQFREHNNSEFPNENGFVHVYDQIGGKIWGKVTS